MSVQVRPATADRWDDLVTVFGRRGVDPSWCWCQLFFSSGTDESLSTGPVPDHRQTLWHEITRAARPPGLIAYIDGRPVGWTRVGPRSTFPRVGGNRALARVLNEESGAWWVTCFAIDSRHRRAGVGSALLDAAVTFAQSRGNGRRGSSGGRGRPEGRSSERAGALYRDHGDVHRRRLLRSCAHVPHPAGDAPLDVTCGHTQNRASSEMWTDSRPPI